MRVAIMQPYLFPYIGYFQLLGVVDNYVVYDDVGYIKGGWINRNNILMNGGRRLLSVSLAHASPNKRINEIDILDDFIGFRKTIFHAYAKAPHLKPVMKLLEEICAFEDKNLARFAVHSLTKIANYLEIDTKLTVSSQLNKNSSLRAQDKVLHICELLGSDMYVNAIGGRGLYRREDFEIRGIDLKFLQTNDLQYVQFGGDFVSNLSIIDVMMFNDLKSIKIMLNNCQLV